MAFLLWYFHEAILNNRDSRIFYAYRNATPVDGLFFLRFCWLLSDWLTLVKKL